MNIEIELISLVKVTNKYYDEFYNFTSRVVNTIKFDNECKAVNLVNFIVLGQRIGESIRYIFQPIYVDVAYKELKKGTYDKVIKNCIQHLIYNLNIQVQGFLELAYMITSEMDITEVDIFQENIVLMTNQINKHLSNIYSFLS